MKLKYYMRGLGVGIIVTTIILGIGKRNTRPSDKEIIDMAKELGMEFVQVEEDSIEKALKGLEPNITEAVKPSPTETIKPSPTETIKPSPTETVEPTPTQAEEPTHVETISFTIKRGMSSIDVAELLKEVGLVEDARDFNRYINKQGKASVIRVGTFTLPETATYEEIIDTIS